jgi:hypothetical protein
LGKFYEGLGDELSLHVRQIAWLRAAPSADENPISGIKLAPLSRLEKLKADGLEPDLPEVSAAYLLSYLWDAGPVIANGVGGAPLSSIELMAWQEGAGIELQPWEFRLLRRLSSDYVAESRKAEDKNCPPPFGELQRSRNLNKNIDLFLD